MLREGGHPARTAAQPIPNLPPPPRPPLLPSRDNSSAIQRLLSLVNLILCGGMIALSVLTLIQFRGMDLAEACLATYMIIFAALLALYELMWWFTIDVVNKSMRKNFGFLYGIKGKAGFMIFVAFLVIGLEFSLAWLRYTVGVAFLLDGLLHLFLHFSKPEVLGTYSAPTGGLANVV